jgi:glycosyltransferase involved in cell wall biosynthesis
MNIFKEWLLGTFSEFMFSEEIENIFSYSTGWKNLRTVWLTDKNEKKIRVDFRLAYKNVAFENLVDFIDYRYLNKKGQDKIDKYYLIYLGNFDTDIPDDQINKRFFIDSRINEIFHRYYSIVKDKLLTKIIVDNFCSDFEKLQPISVKESVANLSADNKFGLRLAGIEKTDQPEHPLISIIVPSFNSESIIEQALQSAIVQSYTNTEIIIVDGGSTDSTAAVVKKYENKIDLFNSEPDKNIFDAINKGTYISRGMYSIFIGSDDLLLPDALENFVMSCNENGMVDFMYGDYLNLHPSGRITLLNTYVESKYYGKFLIGHPAMFIRKKTFEELNGFNDEYYICADADFELKLITKNKNGRKLEKTVCIFRGGGHSSFKKDNAKQVYKIFKNYNALNIRYYYFSVKMLAFNSFIKIFGKKSFAKIVSLKRKLFIS